MPIVLDLGPSYAHCYHMLLDTAGRRMLGKKLRLHGYTQRWLAGILGIKQSSVSLWSSGRARPEAHHRLALWNLLRISPRAWLTDNERAVVAHAKATRAKLPGTNTAKNPAKNSLLPQADAA